MATLNDSSSPLILPSERARSPCRPDMVPVRRSPSTLKLNVVSRVSPPRPGTCATHVPVTSAAWATVAKTASPATSNDSLAFILTSSRKSSLYHRRPRWRTRARSDTKDAMKALVLKAYGQLEVRDVPPPGIGPRDVLVRVMACGICGSDVHGMDGSTGRRIPPIVMGHEAAGLVERVGAQVTSFAAGDRVTFDSTIYNPESFFSRRGLVNLCDDRRVLGVSCEDYRQDGAFAELVAVPSHILYSLPPGMTFEQAAMVEPVSIAVHARNLTPIEGGDTA